ncbi:hypothetical protein, conserved [Eimeria brunetti]|uniref:Uncharacterized protein n=1 Tax=Eimeria brunetti TaxID=51314 RepID=U6LQ72_9EIME|nr:hypothetical protein, conserved [Eimeria brunetti]
MDIQLRDAGTWLSRALGLHTGEDEAAQSDTDSAEKSDAVVQEGGFFPLRYRGKKALETKAIIAAVAVILISGAHYMISRSRSRVKPPQLALDNVSMEEYLDNFNKAAEKMEEAWEASGLPVRQAFQKHFTPSLEDSQQLTEDPLVSIRDHVAKMRDCKVPPESSVEARGDFAKHLQLLVSICRTVTFRLEELNWLVRVSEKQRLPIPVPGYDEPYNYPPLESLEKNSENGMLATQFLSYVGLVGGDPTQKVAGSLAHRLLSLLAIESKHKAYSSMSRFHFERFLQPFREDGAHSVAKYKIPYTGKQFRIDALQQAAANIFRESDNTPAYANERKMHRIANNWTTEGALEAAKRQEKENVNCFEKRLNDRREQMRLLRKDGIVYDDPVSIALFLL